MRWIISYLLLAQCFAIELNDLLDEDQIDLTGLNSTVSSTYDPAEAPPSEADLDRLVGELFPATTNHSAERWDDNGRADFEEGFTYMNPILPYNTTPNEETAHLVPGALSATGRNESSSSSLSTGRRLQFSAFSPWRFWTLWETGVVRNFFHTCAFQASARDYWWIPTWLHRVYWRATKRRNITPEPARLGQIDTASYSMNLLGSETMWGNWQGIRWMPAICDHTGRSWFSVGGASWCSDFRGVEMPPECGCLVCSSWTDGGYVYPTDNPWLAYPETSYGMNAIIRYSDWRGWKHVDSWGALRDSNVDQRGFSNGFLTVFRGPWMPGSTWNHGLRLWRPRTGDWLRRDPAGLLIFAQCEPWLQRYVINPWQRSPFHRISVCGPRRQDMPRFFVRENRLIKVHWHNWVPITFKACRGWWFWRRCWYWDYFLGSIEAGMCTNCVFNQFQEAPCTWNSNARCGNCLTLCGAGAHTDRVCDGRIRRPACVSCLASMWRGDQWGNQLLPWTYGVRFDGNAVAVMRCVDGTYNIRSGNRDELMVCYRNGGWDVRGQVCRPCDPIRLPMVRSPYPFPYYVPGPGRSRDWFEYTCAPGFSDAQGRRSLHYRCPVSQNWGGAIWQPEGNRPLLCLCDGISSGGTRSHTCATNGLHEGWIRNLRGAPDYLTFSYNALPDVWPNNPRFPEWRGSLLGAMRVVFEVDSIHGRLVYEFEPIVQADSRRKWNSGEIRLSNTRQFQSAWNRDRGGPYFHAEAIVFARSSSSTSDDSRIPVNLKAKENDIDLEEWYGSESALRQRMPNAHAYFAVPLFAERFSLSIRVVLFGTDTGLLEAHFARESSTPPFPWQNSIWQFFTKRAVASVQFAWLSRHCPAGTYQVGAVCEPCPSGFFSDLPYRSLDFAIDQVTLDRSGLKAVTGLPADQPICRKCSCLSCQTCGPASPVCRTFPTFCSWSGTCYEAWWEPPQPTKCQWCSPSIAQDRLSPQPPRRPCTDDDICTFFDQCDGQGFCIGTPSDCLSSRIDPSRDCEVCGNDKCEQKPGYAGCTFYLPRSVLRNGRNVTLPGEPRFGAPKVCGCNIDGVCYPHQGLHPNNTCQWCDVTVDPTKWSPTPPKSCNDGQACTYADMCSAGRCVGTSIVCAVTAETPCLRSSTCTGTDKCALVYHNTSRQCADSVGFCQPPVFCTGSSAACPPPARLIAVITPGDLMVLPNGRVGQPGNITQAAAVSLNRQAANGQLPGLSEMGVPYTDLAGIMVRPGNWSVRCGGLTYRVGLYRDVDRTIGCNGEAVTSDVGYGFGPWTTNGRQLEGWRPFPAAPFDTSVPAASTPVIIPDGTRLVARVEAFGLLGQQRAVTACYPLVADSTPPIPGALTIVDIVSAERAAFTVHPDFVSTPTLAFSWAGFTEQDFTSTWAGSLRMQYAIGTAPNGTNVYDWAEMPLLDRSIETPLFRPLPVLTPLHVTLRAINKAGLSATVTSRSVTIDPSPPLPGLVFNGLDTGPAGTPIQKLGVDTAATVLDPFLHVQWNGFSDPHSGIERYQVAFGFSSGGTDVLPWTDAEGGALARNFSLPFDGWTVGSRYIASVRAINRAGGATVVASTGMFYDDSAPQALAMEWVSGTRFALCTGARVSYTYIEPETIVTNAVVWAGSAVNDTNYLQPTILSGPTVGSWLSLPQLNEAQDGMPIYLTAQVINSVGLRSEPASLAGILDCSAPEASGGPVLVPAGASDIVPYPVGAASNILTTTLLAATWQPCTDNVSAIDRYELRVMGTTQLPALVSPQGPSLASMGLVPGEPAEMTELLPWTSLGLQTSTRLSQFIGAGLIGRTYSVSVRCVSGAAAITELRPRMGSVAALDNTTATVANLTLFRGRFTPDPATLPVAWTSADRESGILLQRVAIMAAGTIIPPAESSSWVPVPPTVSNWTFTGLALTTATPITFAVEVTNRAGLVIRARGSSNTTVDVTPPTVFGVPLDGLGPTDADASAQMAATMTYSTTWSGMCTDTISGIIGYRVCAGRAQGDCDAAPAVLLPPTQTSATIRLEGLNESSISCRVDRGRMLLGEEQHGRSLAAHEAHARVLQINLASVTPGSVDATPPWFGALSTTSCITNATVLSQAQGFGQVQVCPGRNVSAVTRTNVRVGFGNYTSWTRTAMADVTVFSHELHTGGWTCGSGRRQAAVQYVCAENNLRLITALAGDGCSLFLTVSVPEVCGSNMAVRASPSPTPVTPGSLLTSLITATPSSTPSATPTPSSPALALGTRTAPPIRQPGPSLFYGPDIFRNSTTLCIEANITGCSSSDPEDNAISVCREGLDSNLPLQLTSLTVCPFAQVQAEDPASTDPFALGWWDRWTTITHRGRPAYENLLFVDGESCSAGNTTWSTIVSFECGPTASVLSVFEAPACTLNIKLSLPTACQVTVCPTSPSYRIFGSVTCLNGAGLSSSASSDGVLLDAQPPMGGVVQYGPPSQVYPLGQYYPIPSSGSLARKLSTRLTNVTASSGIAQITVAVGSSPGASDILAPLDTGGTTVVVIELPSFELRDGAVFYVSFQVVANNGLSSSFTTSTPALYDASPPRLGRLSLAPGSALVSNLTVWPAGMPLRMCVDNVLEPDTPVTKASLLLGSLGSSTSGQFGETPVALVRPGVGDAAASRPSRASNGISSPTLITSFLRSDFAYGGNAVDGPAPGVIRLNGNSPTNDVNGRAVVGDKITFPDGPFRITFSQRFTDVNNACSGDGHALYIHNDPRGRLHSFPTQGASCWHISTTVSGSPPVTNPGLSPLFFLGFQVAWFDDHSKIYAGSSASSLICNDFYSSLSNSPLGTPPNINPGNYPHLAWTGRSGLIWKSGRWQDVTVDYYPPVPGDSRSQPVWMVSISEQDGVTIRNMTFSDPSFSLRSLLGPDMQGWLGFGSGTGACFMHDEIQNVALWSLPDTSWRSYSAPPVQQFNQADFRYINWAEPVAGLEENTGIILSRRTAVRYGHVVLRNRIPVDRAFKISFSMSIGRAAGSALSCNGLSMIIHNNAAGLAGMTARGDFGAPLGIWSRATGNMMQRSVALWLTHRRVTTAWNYPRVGMFSSRDSSTWANIFPGTSTSPADDDPIPSVPNLAATSLGPENTLGVWDSLDGSPAFWIHVEVQYDPEQSSWTVLMYDREEPDNKAGPFVFRDPALNLLATTASTEAWLAFIGGSQETTQGDPFACNEDVRIAGLVVETLDTPVPPVSNAVDLAATVCLVLTQALTPPSGVLTCADPDSVIVGFNFASYGSPAGSCGAFTYSNCHLEATRNILGPLCIGKNTCTVVLSTSTWTAPCPSLATQPTPYHLRVQARCGRANTASAGARALGPSIALGTGMLALSVSATVRTGVTLINTNKDMQMLPDAALARSVAWATQQMPILEPFRLQFAFELIRGTAARRPFASIALVLHADSRGTAALVSDADTSCMHIWSRGAALAVSPGLAVVLTVDNTITTVSMYSTLQGSPVPDVDAIRTNFFRPGGLLLRNVSMSADVGPWQCMALCASSTDCMSFNLVGSNTCNAAQPYTCMLLRNAPTPVARACSATAALAGPRRWGAANTCPPSTHGVNTHNIINLGRTDLSTFTATAVARWEATIEYQPRTSRWSIGFRQSNGPGTISPVVFTNPQLQLERILGRDRAWVGLSATNGRDSTAYSRVTVFGPGIKYVPVHLDLTALVPLAERDYRPLTSTFVVQSSTATQPVLQSGNTLCLPCRNVTVQSNMVAWAPLSVDTDSPFELSFSLHSLAVPNATRRLTADGASDFAIVFHGDTALGTAARTWADTSCSLGFEGANVPAHMVAITFRRTERSRIGMYVPAVYKTRSLTCPRAQYRTPVYGPWLYNDTITVRVTYTISPEPTWVIRLLDSRGRRAHATFSGAGYGLQTATGGAPKAWFGFAGGSIGAASTVNSISNVLYRPFDEIDSSTLVASSYTNGSVFLPAIVRPTTLCFTAPQSVQLAPSSQYAASLLVANAAGGITLARLNVTTDGGKPTPFGAWPLPFWVPAVQAIPSATPAQGMQLNRSGTGLVAAVLVEHKDNSDGFSAPIAAYYFGFGSKPGATDLVPFTFLDSASNLARRDVPIQLEGGIVIMGVTVNFTMPVPAASMRGYVTIAAVSSAWVNALATGASDNIPFETVATTATSSVPLWYDLTAPAFGRSTSMSVSPVALVGEDDSQDAADFIAGYRQGGSGFGGARGSGRTRTLTAQWPLVTDAESGVQSLHIMIRRLVFPFHGPVLNTTELTVVPWTDLSPSTTSFRFESSTWLQAWNRSMCPSSASSFGFADRAGIFFVVLANSALCCTRCTNNATCIAFEFSNSDGRCYMAANGQGGTAFITRFNSTAGSWSLSRPSWAATVRARNFANLTTETTSVPLVIDLIPPTAPAELAVLDLAGCTGNRGNITTQHKSLVYMPVFGRPDVVTLCVAFSAAVDEGSGIDAYAVALGSGPGASDVLGWTTVNPAAGLVFGSVLGAPTGNMSLSAAAGSRVPVTRFVTPPFPLPAVSGLFVSVRAYDGAGLMASRTVGPVRVLPAGDTSTVGFYAWSSLERTSVRAFPANTSALPMSWTGPGGDAAARTWVQDAGPSSPIPGGLDRFEVGVVVEGLPLSSDPAVPWVSAGRSQRLTLDLGAVDDACANILPGMLQANATMIGSVRSAASLSVCCGLCNTEPTCVAWQYDVGAPAGSSCELYADVRALIPALASDSRVLGMVGLYPMNTKVASRLDSAESQPNGFQVLSDVVPLGARLIASAPALDLATCIARGWTVRLGDDAFSIAAFVMFYEPSAELNFTGRCDLLGTPSGYRLTNVSIPIESSGTELVVLRPPMLTAYRGAVVAVSNAGVRSAPVLTAPFTFVAHGIWPAIVSQPAWIGGSPTFTCRWTRAWSYGTPMRAEVALGTSSGASNIVPFAAVPRDLDHTAGASFDVAYRTAAAAAASATGVFCTVRVCHQGNRCAVSSAPRAASVDTVPAVPGRVALYGVADQPSALTRNVTTMPIDITITRAVVTQWVGIAWTPFSCGASGIVNVTVCVGDAPGLCNLAVPVSTPPSRNNSVLTLRLSNGPGSGARMFASVTGTCGAGQSAVATSGGTMNDLTAPEPPSVVRLSSRPIIGLARTSALSTAGNGTNGTSVSLLEDWFPRPTSLVYCAWNNATDADTGRWGFNYTVGISYVDDDPSVVITSRSVGTATSAFFNFSLPSLPPLAQGPIYCIVNATNAAGLTSTSISGAVPGDWQPPDGSNGTVWDGPDPSKDAALSVEPSDRLSVTWRGFFDRGGGITNYEACIATYGTPGRVLANGCNVRAWTVTTGTSTHTFNGVGLQSGGRYFVCVRAWDGTERFSQPACSNGVFVDDTAPSVSAAVRADAELELMRQARSRLETGWFLSHIFASASEAESSISSIGVSANASDALSTSQEATRRLQLEAVVAAASNDTMIQPRLTIGVRWGSGTSTEQRDGCVLSNMRDDKFKILTPQESIAMAISATPTASVTIGGAVASIAAVCRAGTYREPLLDACVPCAEATFKAWDGDDGCSACPANSLSAAQGAVATITDVEQQTKRGKAGDGAIECACWDDTQVFVADQGCVCKPGTLPNPAWAGRLPRRFSGDLAARKDAPRMCLVINATQGQEYKSLPGDSSSLVRTCPAGTSVREDKTGCACSFDRQTFLAVEGRCRCDAGFFLRSQVSSDGGTTTGCAPCAGVVVDSADPSDPIQRCLPCPWGTLAVAGREGCAVDEDIIQGGSAITLPNQTLACPAGSGLTARFAPNLLTGLFLVPASWAPGSNITTVTRPVCLPLPPSAYTGPDNSATIDGVAILAGQQYRLVPDGSSDVQFVNFSSTKWGYLIPAAWRIVNVSSVNNCSYPGAELVLKCEPCGAGEFQPSTWPLLSVEHVRAVHVGRDVGRCSACPSDLLRGSFFASHDRTLHLNWTGIFSDGNGTGIEQYQYAIGTVPGGSQVVPFTSVLGGRTTTATIPAYQVAVVTGTPMYVTLVAIDAAGNRAVLEDTRPVVVDDTSPIPGIVQDGDLWGILGNASKPSLASDAASPGMAPSSATTDIADSGFAGAGDMNATSTLTATTDSFASVLANVPDAETANATSMAAIVAALQRSGLGSTANASVVGSASAPVLPPETPWYEDTTFVALIGVPDVDASADSSSYAFTWEPFLDTGSGIAQLAVCIGALPYSCDVLPLQLIPRVRLVVDTLTLTDLSLPSGVTLFGMVVAVNGVGLVSRAVSNGVLIDDQPPRPGRVFDTGKYLVAPRARDLNAIVGAPDVVDLDCDVPDQGFGAAWEGFSSILGIERYEWSLGTRPYGTDIQPLVAVGRSSSALNTTATAPVGTTVYATVRAVGRNGLSIMASSDGLQLIPATTDTSADADGCFVCLSAGQPAQSTGSGQNNTLALSSIGILGLQEALDDLDG